MKKHEIIEATNEWFEDAYSSCSYDEDDYYISMAGSYRKFLRVLKNKDADPIVDACCMDIGVDECSDDRDIVESALAKCAAIELKFA